MCKLTALFTEQTAVVLGHCRTETSAEEHCGNMTHVIWDILGNIFTLCCVLVSLPKHHFHARSEIQETIHSSLQAIRGLCLDRIVHNETSTLNIHSRVYFPISLMYTFNLITKSDYFMKSLF